MIESDDFVNALREAGFDFFTGVPDTILGGIIDALSRQRLYVPSVREDEAVAMAAGAFLGGKVPVALMQNSGLGNALNVLLSLHLIYKIPCLLIVSWRGFEGKDAPEHLVMGRAMPQLTEAVEIAHRTPSPATMADDLRWAGRAVTEQRVPVALFLKQGVVKTVQP